MAAFCHNCGRQVREDMAFCPSCGVDLRMFDEGGPGYAGARSPYPTPAPQGPVGLPMAPSPYPMVYRPPLSGQRIMVVAGAIILIIDAGMASMLSLIMIFGLMMYFSGAFMFAAAIMGFISAFIALASFNPRLIMAGPILLILAAVALMTVEFDAIFVAMVGSSMAAISLILFLLGWKDSTARYEAKQAGFHPSMAGYVQPSMHSQPPVYGAPEPPGNLRVHK
ncbi:MAG: zinc ribbon domain-containing protein [Thermoplasmata archaeon]|nr:MAG: zinc ribbon domain-containing protein [Thermoplasmata archaeon]